MAYVTYLKVTGSNQNSQVLTLRLGPLSPYLPISKVKRKLELVLVQNPVLHQHLLIPNLALLDLPGGGCCFALSSPVCLPTSTGASTIILQNPRCGSLRSDVRNRPCLLVVLFICSYIKTTSKLSDLTTIYFFLLFCELAGEYFYLLWQGFHSCRVNCAGRYKMASFLSLAVGIDVHLV